MPSTYYNKLVIGNETKFDLTGDTVAPETLLKDQTAHDKSGAPITGTCTFDSDTTDATITVAEMLTGKTAYVRKQKLTGTMPNNEAVAGKISTVDEEISIPLGFHDGSGKVSIDPDEQAKIIPANIKQGVSILGALGTYSGEGVTLQTKEVTPKMTAQTVTADEGYDALSSVTVKAIPYVESDNAAGGKTITIG